MDEWELLQAFARNGSQAAFEELVTRHLNFVYSSARRQVRSPQLAQEIAQTVFLELARQAPRLKPGPPLTSWLYFMTRRSAVNALRTEGRRQAREQVAYELSTMNSVPSGWAQLEPRLDEALATLNQHDRSALLLRYFENKPLREVGAALGSSEEAAQKRVSRALGQLRKFFAKQGIAIGSTGLATQLSAHAIEAAPVGLSGLITTAAGALGSAVPVLALEPIRILAMTSLQKTFLIAAVIVVAAGVYEVRALADGRERIRSLEAEALGLSARALALGRARDEARERLTRARADAARSAPAAPEPTAADQMITEIMARAEQLRQQFDRDPSLRIPELVLLKEGDWLQVARERPVDAENDRRASLGRIRTLAKSHFAAQLTWAFSAYVQGNAGQVPTTAMALQPHFPPSHEPADLRAMLGRYDIPPRGVIADVPHNAVLILENEQALIDHEYDTRMRISRMRLGSSDPDPLKINFGHNHLPGPRAARPPQYTR